MRHKNPLEIFPDGHPPPPGEIRQIDPPPLSGKSDTLRGGGMDIYWNHTINFS